jgi:oligoendopeptidase F
MIEKYQGVDKEWKNKVKTQPYIFSLSTIVRISHFYVGNFYVYKYAIGQIIATIVATEIFNKNKNMISKYFKFLSSGNSLTPYETIKLLGLDIKSGDTFSKAFSYVANWIEEFKKL